MGEALDDVPHAEATVAELRLALERERARAREVDHRAKNSLQLVSSMLLLLSRRSAEPETQRALKSMHQRIGAVAAVHREILGSERSDRILLTQVVREHVGALTRLHGRGATVRLELDPVEVAASHACPLALILNELTLNALVHGAAGERPVEVTIGLNARPGAFELAIADDGPGLPEGAGGFGLTMVRMLAQQIGAEVAFEPRQPGLQVRVTGPSAT